MCDFDPPPGFYGAVIGSHHFGAADVFFVVFALVVAFLRLGTVLTDTKENYSGAKPLARIRFILIGIGLVVIGACISAFIIEPTDSAIRIWRGVTEPHVSGECLQSFHALDNMANAIGFLIFLLGWMLPFGLGMLLILFSGRRAKQARSATFT